MVTVAIVAPARLETVHAFLSAEKITNLKLHGFRTRFELHQICSEMFLLWFQVATVHFI